MIYDHFICNISEKLRDNLALIFRNIPEIGTIQPQP
jgi:hypothetical protein